MGQPGCNTTKPTTIINYPYAKPYHVVECRNCDYSEDCIHKDNANKQGHWSNGFCEQERRKRIKQ